MSLKKRKQLFSNIIFNNLLKDKQKSNIKPIKAYQNLYTLNITQKVTINSTGFFFKKLAFIGLAHNSVFTKKYQISTIRSTILSL